MGIMATDTRGFSSLHTDPVDLASLILNYHTGLIRLGDNARPELLIFPERENTSPGGSLDIPIRPIGHVMSESPVKFLTFGQVRVALDCLWAEEYDAWKLLTDELGNPALGLTVAQEYADVVQLHQQAQEYHLSMRETWGKERADREAQYESAIARGTMDMARTYHGVIQAARKIEAYLPVPWECKAA